MPKTLLLLSVVFGAGILADLLVVHSQHARDVFADHADLRKLGRDSAGGLGDLGGEIVDSGCLMG